MKQWGRLALACALCIGLVSCGGGGDAPPEPVAAVPTNPQVSAVPELAGVPVMSVTVRGGYDPKILRQEERYMYLDATATRDPAGGVLTYQWSLVQRPAGSTRELVPTEVPHIMAFDPDLAGDYVARLVASNAKQTMSATLDVPFRVQPDAPFFTEPTFALHDPLSCRCSGPSEPSVVVGRVFSNYPWTLELYLDGQPKGTWRETDTPPISIGQLRQPTSSYWGFSIAGLPAGTHQVKAIVRAGGRSAEFQQQLVFPAP